MGASTFDQILAQGVRKGNLPGRTQDAISWYRNTAKKTRITDPSQFIEDHDRARFASRIEPGTMYLFQYDPKHKKTLPYYDTFPLIFPFEVLSDGFMGLNMHYLPPMLRARLMDGLYDLTTDNNYDENTRLELSYGVLKSAAKYSAFRPCVKRYLAEHVQSRFLQIFASEWDISLFLPLQRFHKASAATVWRDSREKV